MHACVHCTQRPEVPFKPCCSGNVAPLPVPSATPPPHFESTFAATLEGFLLIRYNLRLEGLRGKGGISELFEECGSVLSCLPYPPRGPW